MAASAVDTAVKPATKIKVILKTGAEILKALDFNRYKITADVRKVIALAKAIGGIATEADAQTAAKTRLTLHQQKKSIELHYAGMKKPLNDAKALVMTFEREDLQDIVAAIANIDKRAGEFVMAENARRATARREVAEAVAVDVAEQRADAVETYTAVAAAEDDPDVARAILEEGRKLAEAPLPMQGVNDPSLDPVKIPGMPKRELVRVSCYDLRALVQQIARGEAPLELIAFAQGTANDLATNHEGEIAWAGCSVERVPSFSSR